MAYLGALGGGRNIEPTLAWSQYIIASVLLPTVIGQYGAFGGYVYVK